MALPSEESVRAKLRERGAAAHVLEGGSPGLIEAWRSFVATVEQGYGLGLDDYRNDLDIRTLIAAVGLDEAVVAEDARLRNLLVENGRPIWSSDIADAFWVQGYPRNASGELLRDLRAEGLV